MAHSHPCRDKDCPDRIADKDKRLLLGLAHGLTLEATSLKAGMRPGTGKNRLTMVYRELGAISAAHAVALALKQGVLKLRDV